MFFTFYILICFVKNYINTRFLNYFFQYEFVLALFNFINSINSLNLNDSEIGIFCAVILLTSGKYTADYILLADIPGVARIKTLIIAEY